MFPKITQSIGQNRALAPFLAIALLTAALAKPISLSADDEAPMQETIEHIVHDLFAHAAARSAESAPKCVDLPNMSVMFDPEATEVEVLEALEMVSSDASARFQPHTAWTSTATNGALQAGQAFTLTYSFVPDGTLIETSYNAATGSDLQSRLNTAFGGNTAAWKEAFADVFAQWSEYTNITYVEASDDGAAWGSVGQLGARGDIRIGATPLGTPLAVNHYPYYGGDMVIDSADVAYLAFDSIRLHNTVAHEHGHGLGLKHVHPINNTKLMEPFLNTNFDGPQEDDIRGAQWWYGDWAEPNEGYGQEPYVHVNSPQGGGYLWHPNQYGTLSASLENLALEHDDSEDWFGFVVSGSTHGFPITFVRVEPLGTTYQQGPQTDDASTLTNVNAKAARDLKLEMFRRVNSQTGELQLMATYDVFGAGQDEYNFGAYFGIGGYYLLRISSDDGFNDVQRYRLTISNAPIAETVQPPAMTVFNLAAGQQVFDGTFVQFGQTNIGSASNQTLTISNSGEGTLQIGQISLAGPGAGDYSFTLLGNPVAPGGSGTLGIVFAPTAAGVRQAVMTLPNNDPDQPNFSFILSGSGVQPTAPQIEVSIDGLPVADNDSHDLGELEVGAAIEIELLVNNTGDAALTLSNGLIVGAATTADTAMHTQFPRTIQPGQSDPVLVVMTVTAEEIQTARISLLNNSTDPTYVVNLSALGVAAVQEPVEDCDGNGAPDAEDIDNDPSLDCDGNGRLDACDIAEGTAFDCDGDGVLDQCEEDCDGNGTPDDCDLADGTHEDCNENGIPDVCEVDTDGDGVIDACDECEGADDTLDTDGDGTPDCLDPDPEDPKVGGRQKGVCGTGSAMPLMMAMLCLCGTGIRRRRIAARPR